MIGTTIGHYEILTKLGQGGMGVVYKARDTRLDRPVALKVLPAELMKDPERRQRFVLEAKAASAVNHPAIAQIYGIETEGEVSYITMEYVDGSNVRQLIEHQELDVPSALEVGIQIGSALARAHQSGIIHRDIKSDNIMVTKDGHPKILDFGLAKLLDLTGPGANPNESATVFMTQAGVVMGTASYMSPEQARGLPADQRSDIFSFGIVLYEMATGRLPFEGKSALDTMHAIAFDKTRPMSDLRAGLPFTLQSIVDRCLEKDPARRYQDMDSVVDALQEVKRDLDSGVSRSAPLLHRFWPRRLGGDLRGAFGGMSTKGLVFIAGWSIVLLTFIVLILANKGGPAGILPFLVAGLFVYRRFRSKRSRMLKKFVGKARKEPAVRLITVDGTRILVLLDDAPAKTYLKLNSHLEGANDGLFTGEPFTMEIRTNSSVDEQRELVRRSGLQYVRDDA